MHAASAFSHASGHHSVWLSGTLTLVGEMNVHKLLQVSTSWYLKGPFVIFNKVSAYPYATPNPLCNSKKEESATTNYLISYFSKLNWFWSGCCQKKKKERKKENLGPGEDYSVYKSKPAASICHGILFKKESWFDNPLSGLCSLQVWETGKVLKHKEQVLSWKVCSALPCGGKWGVCLAIHQRELPQQLMMTGSYVNGFQEPGTEKRSPLSRKDAKKRLVCGCTQLSFTHSANCCLCLY